MVYHLFVAEGNGDTQAAACSNTNGDVFISADTLQECLERLPEGQRLLEDAMQSWEPDERQDEAGKDPGQERKERIKAFEDSTQGKRFLRSLEISKEFYGKKDNGHSLLFDETSYLYDRTIEDGLLISTMFDVFCLAFRKGYKAAQKDAKKTR